MSSLRRAAALVLAAALLAAPAPARAYLALGVTDCATVIEEDANEHYALANLLWVLGYLTARNFVDGADSGALYDDDEIYEMLLDFCADNPQADLDAAGEYLFEALQ